MTHDSPWCYETVSWCTSIQGWAHTCCTTFTETRTDRDSHEVTGQTRLAVAVDPSLSTVSRTSREGGGEGRDTADWWSRRDVTSSPAGNSWGQNWRCFLPYTLILRCSRTFHFEIGIMLCFSLFGLISFQHCHNSFEYKCCIYRFNFCIFDIIKVLLVKRFFTGMNLYVFILY